ncbi:MAG: DoxX family protein [Rhabdochlamydiaceae bacterium]|nr:DoxX family protein [Rhabdochlamydiaceae bacterium]
MIKTICLKLISCLESLKAFPLLALRWILAYGFLTPAMEKLKNFDSVVMWFGTLNLPYPKLQAYLAVSTEVCGVILLFLGLLTRLISIPLIILLSVAIATVHWSHGFSFANNGFEIALYYILMLFVLLVFGPGGISVDAWIKRRWLKSNHSR